MITDDGRPYLFAVHEGKTFFDQEEATGSLYTSSISSSCQWSLFAGGLYSEMYNLLQHEADETITTCHEEGSNEEEEDWAIRSQNNFSYFSDLAARRIMKQKDIVEPHYRGCF
jgi:hypothetical protein